MFRSICGEIQAEEINRLEYVPFVLHFKYLFPFKCRSLLNPLRSVILLLVVIQTRLSDALSPCFILRVSEDWDSDIPPGVWSHGSTVNPCHIIIIFIGPAVQLQTETL